MVSFCHETMSLCIPLTVIVFWTTVVDSEDKEGGLKEIFPGPLTFNLDDLFNFTILQYCGSGE